MNFDNDVRIGLVELLKPLLIRNLKLTFADIAKFTQALGYAEVERLCQIQKSHNDKATEELVSALMVSIHPVWFAHLISVVEQKGLKYLEALLRCQVFKDLPNFSRILRCIPQMLCDIQDPVVLLDDLVRVKCLTANDVHAITDTVATQGSATGVRLLLCIVAKSLDDWYWKFMNALLKHGHGPLVTIVHRNYFADYNDFKVKAVRGSSIKVLPSNAQSISEAVEYTRRLNISSDTDVSRSLQKQPLKLRSYQTELVDPVLNGKNTIICAPTGSGKTIVAIKAIQHHLEHQDEHDNVHTHRKVAFFVPTAQLVEQQSELMRTYLNCRIKGMKGGETSALELARNQLIRCHDLIVMTPAILLNVMSDLEDECRVELTEFSMLIFDECHHTTKDHPYMQIMAMYFDLKRTGALAASQKLPQVVGLTASLGTGGALTLSLVREHILSICAKMDCNCLSTVELYAEELKAHVHVPKDELIQVAFNKQHAFIIQICTIMSTVRKLVAPFLDDALKARDAEGNKVFTVNVKQPKDVWSEEYSSWVCTLLAKAPELLDTSLKRNLITCFEHLKIYHCSLYIHNHVSTKAAFAYLKTSFQEKQENICSELDGKLMKLFFDVSEYLSALAAACSEVELSQRLKVELLREYQSRPDFRALVFVMTREMTIALEQFLREDPATAVLIPGRLVSSNAAGYAGGQSSREQKDVLEEFRDGRRKVIIATTVAEEGLDVAKCNLVIKYNHVTNEIAMVQKRGRGRAEGSRSVLMTFHGHRVDQEIVNMEREKLMRQALVDLKARSQEYLNSEILTRQEQDYRDRQIAKNQLIQKRIELGNKKFLISCTKCDAVICNSDSLRCIENNYHVVCDREFWSQCYTAPHEDPKNFITLSLAGKFICKSCRQPWGLVVKYNDLFWPALKVDNVVFLEVNEAKEIVAKRQAKTWKEVKTNLMPIESLARSDICKMMRALNPPSYLDAVIQETFEKNAAPLNSGNL